MISLIPTGRRTWVMAPFSVSASFLRPASPAGSLSYRQISRPPLSSRAPRRRQVERSDRRAQADYRCPVAKRLPGDDAIELALHKQDRAGADRAASDPQFVAVKQPGSDCPLPRYICSPAHNAAQGWRPGAASHSLHSVPFARQAGRSSAPPLPRPFPARGSGPLADVHAAFLPTGRQAEQEIVDAGFAQPTPQQPIQGRFALRGIPQRFGYLGALPAWLTLPRARPFPPGVSSGLRCPPFGAGAGEEGGVPPAASCSHFAASARTAPSTGSPDPAASATPRRCICGTASAAAAAVGLDMKAVHPAAQRARPGPLASPAGGDLLKSPSHRRSKSASSVDRLEIEPDHRRAPASPPIPVS